MSPTIGGGEFPAGAGQPPDRSRAGDRAHVWDGSWLIGRIGENDTGALEELYRMWGDRLYSMALHLVGDEGTAAEAVQDCFLKIWKKAGDFDPAKSSGFTWAGIILRGICLDALRKRKRRAGLWGVPREESLLRLPAHSCGVEDLFFRETIDRVRTALDHLSEQEAESIRTALFDPGTLQDHASRWGIPAATAKTRMFRAMAKLRLLLGYSKGGGE